MIHSFNVIKNKNGNVTITFLQNSKSRSIILNKGTEALNDFIDLDFHKLDLKVIITRMKEKYYFKSNVNNKSIFRPIHKSLILNN